jgi:hypothetical protein
MQQPRRARPPAPPRDAAPLAVGSGTGDLDTHIARLLDDAPPLTSAQRDQLALILRRPRLPRHTQPPRQPQPPEPAPAQPARPGCLHAEDRNEPGEQRPTTVTGSASRPAPVRLT